MVAENLYTPTAFGADITGQVQGGTITSAQMWENIIKSGREFKYAHAQANVTANDGGHNLYDTIKKMSIETDCRLGKIWAEDDFKPPVVWDPTSKTTVDSYFPAIDMSALTDAQVIDSTGSSSGLTSVPFTKIVCPGAVTKLRALKATIRRGKATQKTDFILSTFAVSGGTTATLVFAVDTDLTAILADFGEDASVAGATSDLLTYTPDFTKSWVMNLSSSLITGGTTIPSGDYVMTSVNSGTRTVVFTIPATTNVGATASAASCSFYPHRIVGSTTTARIFASQGRVLQGANDGLLENVSPGRRRGRFQGHRQDLTPDGSNKTLLTATAGTAGYAGGGSFSLQTTSSTGNATNSDTANGTPRIGPETDVRSTTVHYYWGLGALEA